MAKSKILIFIVCYNADSTIQAVLNRIPLTLLNNEQFAFEVLIIDDCSSDQTFIKTINHSQNFPHFPIRVLKNPKNLGYGGNQKLGYRYAINNGFDIVALLHGDGQYAPEELSNLLKPFSDENIDAVFGSRMIKRGAARKGGMPLYKYFGNKVLTFLQNRIVGTTLSEYHSGYRLYRCAALSKIPFELNSNGFEFDTEIIIQFHRAGLEIVELPIPTFYGDEICYVQGIPYALKILAISLKSHLQHLGIVYDPKFHPVSANATYQSKFSFPSSPSFALREVLPGENLLIFGCGPLANIYPFIEKGCTVTLVDRIISPEHRAIAHSTFQENLDDCDLQKFFKEPFDAVLLLDVLEHLHNPETFIKKLRTCMDPKNTRVIITTPNIAFAPIRIALLFGQFNYGPRGILDFTHTRLFTFASLRRILAGQGYSILTLLGVPAPFPLALGLNSNLPKLLTSLNSLAIKISKNLFSYQAFIIAKPNPTVSYLLAATLSHTNETIRILDAPQNPR